MRCIVVVLVTAVLVQAEVTTEYSVITTDSTADVVVTTADSETTDTERVGETPVDYTGAEIVRVNAMRDKEMQMLNVMAQNGELEMLGMSQEAADILLRNNSKEHVKEELSYMNASYNVVVDNLQDILQKQMEGVATRSGALCRGNRAGACFNWKKYHSLAEIYAYMDFLWGKYPHLVHVETIGYTFEQRPIKLLKIISTQSRGPTAKAIWVEGGIHAREWISHAATTYIMTKVLQSLEGRNSPFAGLNFYFVPVLNPDGYEYTISTDRLWRKNRSRNKGTDCVGTDLNRNWNYQWRARSHPCTPIYQGSKPFSEPEIAAVSSYMSKVKGLQAYLTIHSYGRVVMFPWSYTKQRVSDYRDLYDLAYFMKYQIQRDTGKQYRFGGIAETMYEAYGSSVDWVRAKLKVKYAIAMELALELLLPESQIVDTCKDAFAGFTVLCHKVNTGRFH